MQLDWLPLKKILQVSSYMHTIIQMAVHVWCISINITEGIMCVLVYKIPLITVISMHNCNANETIYRIIFVKVQQFKQK